ncbi:MAG: MauE/DoxX family redox-associated membrane protein [Planctomycetota bacterium]
MKTGHGLLRRWEAGGWTLLLARLVLAAELIPLSLAKLGDPFGFLKSVHEYQLLPSHPAWFLNTFAAVVPWVELLGGAALLLGVGLRGTASVLGALLAAFTTAILLRGLEILSQGGTGFCDIQFDCGCGTGVVPICPKLASNLLLILLCGLVVLARSRRFTLASFRRSAG